MPIINDQIPTDWEALFSAIEIEIANSFPNDPTGMDAILNPRFLFRPNEGCDVFYLDDKTDYEEITSVDPDNVTINVSFIERFPAYDLLICESQVMTPNSRLTFDKLEMKDDGLYVAIINIIHDDGTVTESTIEEILCSTCTKDCICDLADTTQLKIKDIGCAIGNRKKIGKNIIALKKDLYKLSNVHYVLCNVKLSLKEVECLACIVNSVKSYTC